MDRIIEKKTGIKKKHIPMIAGGAFLAVMLLWLIFGNHVKRLNVENNRVTISTVTQGEFNDYIRVNGQVLPVSTIQISAIEGGMVEEKLVEEGADLKQGDVIVRLSNPMLSLNILDSEAQLAEKENFLRNTQIAMEQELLNLRKERLQLELDVKRKLRNFEQQSFLFEENLVSREEYLRAKEDYEFALDSRQLIEARQRQDSIYRSIQVRQLEESLSNMRENLKIIRQRKDNLNVKAPVDGQLGLLDVEIGQNIPTGGRIGQINVLSDFKVEAMIDEHYIDRVRTGLEATFERQDRNFALKVRKVFPEVRNKQFKTEFRFDGERPDNIRAGQTYYISLQLGQPVEAIMIPRGAFFNTTGGQWIFVLTPDQKKAVKRPIKLGSQNPNFYEVIDGLQPGEKVITSSYDAFGDAMEIILK